MIAPIIYMAFLAVLTALIVFILRQAVPYFRSVKLLFTITCLSYWIVIFLDFIENYLVETELMVYFTTSVGISSALISAIAVEHLVLMFYQKERQKVSWKTFLSNKLYVVSALYKGYVILLLLLTWILTPWQIRQMQNPWGDLVYNPMFESWYLAGLTIVVITVIGYPCAFFLLSERKFKQKEIVNVSNLFGAGCIGIALTLIGFHGILPSLNVEITGISHLFNIIFFGIIAYAFKKTTILESLFEGLYKTTYAPRPTGLTKDRKVFSKALGLTHGQVVGKNILLEIDSTSDYERVIEDFVDEALANAGTIAVFTSKGSAIHSALSNRSDVKFLILTQSVSVPQANTSKNEILLPANNYSLLLDALNKTLKAYPERKSGIVFDNLSSLVLLSGFEKVYGFLRYALELLALENGTSLFLMDPGAHDFKVASTFRSLFKDQITYEKVGLRVIKMSKPLLKT